MAKVRDYELDNTKPRTTGDKVRASDGAAIRPWAEDITAYHIPRGCICIWSYHTLATELGVYRFKFRNQLCPVKHEE